MSTPTLPRRTRRDHVGAALPTLIYSWTLGLLHLVSTLPGILVLRLHLASVRFIEATGRATGMYALLGWVSKRIAQKRADERGETVSVAIRKFLERYTR